MHFLGESGMLIISSPRGKRVPHPNSQVEKRVGELGGVGTEAPLSLTRWKDA